METWSQITEHFQNRNAITFLLTNGLFPNYLGTPVAAWLTERCLSDEIDTTGVFISEDDLKILVADIRKIGEILVNLPLAVQLKIEGELFGF